MPELSVLLAWTKIVLADELLASDLPDDPYLDATTCSPTSRSRCRQGFQGQIADHPLRREIIVTQVVNDLVNGAGMTFWPRLAGETGASAAELTRANFVAREIFASLPLRQELETYDNVLDARVQTRMRLEMRTLVERASRWLVTNRRPPLDSQGTVDFFSQPVQRVMAQLPELMTGRELTAFIERRDGLVEQGVPEDLATRVAVLTPAYTLLGIIEIATREKLDPAEVARVHFALGERLGLPAMVQRILALPRDDRWQTMARGARARRPVRRAHPAHRRRSCWPPRPTTPPRRGSRPGRTATVSWSPARCRRSRRSAPTTPPTWPGCRSACGWCAGCCPPGDRPRATDRGRPRPPASRPVARRRPARSWTPALARIAAADPGLNAFSVVLADRARAEAAARDDLLASGGTPGPLHGVPIAIKEEIDVAGTVTTFGGEANSHARRPPTPRSSAGSATPAPW